MIESYLSAVTVAECDEMGHMNIQHYAAKAEAAADVLSALSNADRGRRGGPQQMHLRFHREMLAGDRLRVTSARADDARSQRLVHHIQNAGTRLVCATAISTYDTSRAPDAPAGEIADDAAPRSLTHPATHDLTQRDDHMVRTHLSAISPADCRADTMTIPAFLQRVSRCQAHLWALAGLDRRQQAQAGLGTASLELRVTRFAPALLGRPLEIVTSFTPPTGKALHYKHLGFDIVTGACCFMAEGVGVMIDLHTRRAVKPPLAQSNFA